MVLVDTYTNINPTMEELRDFAYNPQYKYVEQDWDICVVDFDNRSLYLEFALDENCPHQELFFHMLYVLTGSIVYDVLSYRMTYDFNSEKSIYEKPIKKKGEPVPKDVQEKILVWLGELK